ncbi:hypothetical protein P3T34_006789 [Kitasatospora sp. MAP12-44]|nr:hypothetical protein [Kitasatospora sp. MAP12-44]
MGSAWLTTTAPGTKDGSSAPRSTVRPSVLVKASKNSAASASICCSSETEAEAETETEVETVPLVASVRWLSQSSAVTDQISRGCSPESSASWKVRPSRRAVLRLRVLAESVCQVIRPTPRSRNAQSISTPAARVTSPRPSAAGSSQQPTSATPAVGSMETNMTPPTSTPSNRMPWMPAPVEAWASQ